MSVKVLIMGCGSVRLIVVYSRADFLLELQEKLGNGFGRLGSELWVEHFKHWL